MYVFEGCTDVSCSESDCVIVALERYSNSIIIKEIVHWLSFGVLSFSLWLNLDCQRPEAGER